jgi:hypothetical protein
LARVSRSLASWLSVFWELALLTLDDRLLGPGPLVLGQSLRVVRGGRGTQGFSALRFAHRDIRAVDRISRVRILGELPLGAIERFARDVKLGG